MKVSPNPIEQLSVSEVLAIEDDPRIPAICCPTTNIPLWSLIRFEFFSMIESDMVYRLPAGNSAAKSSSWICAAKSLAAFASSNIRVHVRNKQARLLIASDCVADIWKDGKWFNRLSDPFASILPAESMILMDHHQWKWPYPRQNNNLYFHSPLQVAASLYGRIKVRAIHKRLVGELVDIIEARAKNLLGWTTSSQRRNSLAKRLQRKTAALPYLYSSYTSLLASLRTRVLLLNCGCYGPSAALISAAKDLGITVAEYQHGAISRGHIAYNFASVVADSLLYRRVLPEYLLSYGRWWNQQLDAPIKIRTIGNPHRLTTQPRDTCDSYKRKNMLVLSNGIDFSRFAKLATSLAPIAHAKGQSVILRPHPLERLTLMRQKDLNLPFELDSNTDIFDSFATSHSVIGEISTGLFDALGLVKHIYLWSTPVSRYTYPEHPFMEFTSIESLINLIDSQSNVADVPVCTINELWATGWEESFKTFLGGCGISQ